MTRKQAIERFFAVQPDAAGAGMVELVVLTQEEWEELIADLLLVERWMEQGDREVLRVYYGPEGRHCRFTWE